MNSKEETFTHRLHNYLSDTRKRDNPIYVCETPNALLAIGAKPLPVVMNPNDIDKCLASRPANKNKSSHNLNVEELCSLPELLLNPALIFRSPNTGYITLVTDRFDKDDNPFVIGLEMNVKLSWQTTVNRVASIYGREHALMSFIARNGKEVPGYVIRNILEGNLVAANILKATELLRPTGQQLPEGRNFVTFDDSIAYSLDSVKKF